MQHSHQRQYQNDILHEHRIAEPRPASLEYGGNDIRDERVSETHSGICGVLRWKVVTVHETRDHLQVKREVTKIVREGGEHFAFTFEHGTVEDTPEQHDKEAVEDEPADVSPITPAIYLTKSVCASRDIRKHLATDLSKEKEEEGQSKDADGRDDQECAIQLPNCGAKCRK